MLQWCFGWLLARPIFLCDILDVAWVTLWLEVLNYCPDGENVFFYILWSSSIFCCSSELFFGVNHCVGWLREFGLCVPSYWYFCETGSQNVMFIVTLVCWKMNYEWEYTSETILLIRISSGAYNCGQCVLKKNIIRFFSTFSCFASVKG